MAQISSSATLNSHILKKINNHKATIRMKRVVFLLSLFLLAGFMQTFAQEKTVKGDYNGTTVTIKYIPGDPDYIKKIDYVDKLAEDLKKSSNKLQGLQRKIPRMADSINKIHIAREDSLRGRIRTLENNNKEHVILDSLNEIYAARLDSLQARIKYLDSVIVVLTGPGHNNNKEIIALRSRTFTLFDSLQQANKTIKYLKSLPGPGQHMVDRSGISLAFTYGIGMPLFTNSLIKNKIWDHSQSLSNHTGNIAVVIPIKGNSPFAFEAGLGFTYNKLKAKFTYFGETVNDQVDPLGATYTAICSYKNVEEEVTLMSLNLGPISISYGRPRCSRVSGYGKLGVTFSFNLQRNFNGTGQYDISGYYPEWGITIHDVPELNFNSDGSCYEPVKLSANQFVLWGNISGGVYVPLSKFQEYKEAHFILKIGAKCDYSLTEISKQLDETFIKGAAYRINQSNILAGSGTHILSPGIEIGIIYMLLKK
jgi:hypothetical protein